MPPNKYLSLLYLLLILLPIAFAMLKGGRKRQWIKHVLIWSIIILLLFLVGTLLQNLTSQQHAPLYPLIS